MEAKDVERAYQLGANAFFAKPGKFKELEEILELILRFWERAVRPAVKKPVCR